MIESIPHEFKSFPKIPRFDKGIEICVTQKIHGTNAQVYIFRKEDGELDLICGSRNRWITLEDDNVGFARFVHDNKEEFIRLLGEGRHFGEWAGKGINSGEGLDHKRLFLFNIARWDTRTLPNNVSMVPVIWHCNSLKDYTFYQLVDRCMGILKSNGSLIAPGYMKPEGIVIQIGNQFFKETFDNEEIPWKQSDKKIALRTDEIDVSHLLQPLRLEKLISRDEKYRRDYPVSLPIICSDYVKDLEEEGQLIHDDVKLLKKALSRHLFPFIKDYISTSN